MTNVGSCPDSEQLMHMKSQVVEIVDVVSLKFASNEAAG